MNEWMNKVHDEVYVCKNGSIALKYLLNSKRPSVLSGLDER